MFHNLLHDKIQTLKARLVLEIESAGNLLTVAQNYRSLRFCQPSREYALWNVITAFRVLMRQGKNQDTIEVLAFLGIMGVN